MKTTQIKPNALYWTSFNRFDLRLPGQCVIDCSHSGQCDNDVAHWVPKVRALVESDNFPNKPTAGKIREELREYGTWSDEELKNDDQNWHRLVWCAACNVAEEEKPDCSKPLKTKKTMKTTSPQTTIETTDDLRQSFTVIKGNTPGPWTISADGQRILGVETPDDQPVIATFYGAACDDHEGSANIARAVACVNAMEGIADPGAVPDLLAIAHDLIALDSPDKGMDELYELIDRVRAAIARSNNVTEARLALRLPA